MNDESMVAPPRAERVMVNEDMPQSMEKEWRPTRSESLRNHEVRIRFLTLGCLIEIGCKSIPFATIKEGMEALNEYVLKPYDTIQIWEKRFQEGE